MGLHDFTFMQGEPVCAYQGSRAKEVLEGAVFESRDGLGRTYCGLSVAFTTHKKCWDGSPPKPTHSRVSMRFAEIEM